MQYQLLFLIVLLLANAFFASAEVALISLKQAALRRLAERGKRGAALLALSRDTGRFLATVQVGVTLAGFLASAFAADTFSAPLARLLEKTALRCLGEPALETASLILITVILAFLSLVFGELAPKQIALRFTENIALNVALPIHYLAIFTAPFVWILNKSVSLVMRIFGRSSEEEKITEEEIRMMVDLGEEKGVIESEEKEMIDNVFELNDITASEVMTHRGAVLFIPAEASAQEIRKIVLSGKFTRYPVCRGTLDNAIGVLDAEQYCLEYLRTGKEPEILNVMKNAHFAPKASKIGRLLREMRRNKFQMAVLLDEFGGAAGIVTLHDLLEEIVGGLHESPDSPEEQIRQMPDGSWELGGRVRVAQAARRLNLNLPEESFDTVGGLVLSGLPELPAVGDTLNMPDCRFTVLAVDGKRIVRVKVSQSEPPAKNTNPAV